MKKKNTAVIGAGWFGKAHIRNFYNLSNLVGVCDENKVKLKEVTDIYSETNPYTNVDDLIKNESIDAVSIVTPPKEIPKLARKFADKGIDVLMEKPMALNLEDLSFFKKYDNVRIMPGFIELYNPVFENLLQKLPEIGEIISIASKRIGLYPKRDWDMGVILDLSIHDIYLQERIMGKNKIKNSFGVKKCFKDSKHADAAFIILDFGTAIGQIESNWLTPSKSRILYVNGELGGISADFITQQINIRTGIDLQGEWPITKDVTFNPLRQDEPLKREIVNFLYDKESIVTLDDGIRALDIALKIVNS
ncbi:MAG: gfo/Idh/MocA family oxidoreductase [Candidatus Lokiarchaeota archaeon]|nr:gfo/Idh/MocA family oxidoreductase [Candidatus Lokiarchaeota archaeon]